MSDLFRNHIVGFPTRQLVYLSLPNKLLHVFANFPDAIYPELKAHSFAINPYMTNGFSHHYQLDEPTFIFRGVRSDFYFLSDFSMKFVCANRIFCLPMSHKRDVRLK